MVRLAGLQPQKGDHVWDVTPATARAALYNTLLHNIIDAFTAASLWGNY